MPTRVAVVSVSSPRAVEQAINERLEQLEAERHKLVVQSVKIEHEPPTGTSGSLGSTLGWTIAVILYTDEGSIEEAEAASEQQVRDFEDQFRSQ
jgi:hypothetical protein